MAEELVTLFRHIDTSIKTYLGKKTTPPEYTTNLSEYEDDAWRHYLKEVSAYSFPKVFSEGPAYMILTHLHALTGKCPYEESQIISDVDAWVRPQLPNGELKHLNEAQVKTTLDRLFSVWYKGEVNGFLTFNEYCNDFIRWGTSGGAKKSEIQGETYRTKWAWAYSHSVDSKGALLADRNLYKHSKEEDTLASATVALKEEAQKTREIITTPMPSYLRQCYLLYRWGKPNLNSPISSGRWVGHFERISPNWYGCLDGDKFDQTIPAWFVLDVINRLGNLDAETRMVADLEIEDLKNLKVVWNGREWKWRAGVLSGWRLTSILGTLASVAAYDYICNEHNMQGALDYGALGDDLILYSYNNKIEPKDLVDSYNAFGLKANFYKTTSGKVGEFLRKVISQGGSWGYPALALRSIVYANPWVSNYSFERETEMSNTWMTFISRLIPHSCLQVDASIFNDCITNLRSAFGPGKWKEWIHTPVSAGGGGPVEISDLSKWTKLERKQKNSLYSTDRLMTIPCLLGVIKSTLIFEKTKQFIPILSTNAFRDASILKSGGHNYSVSFKKSANITELLFGFAAGNLNRKNLESNLNAPLPRSVRGSGVKSILSYLLMGSKGDSGYTSICHTKESAACSSALSKFLTRAIGMSKRFNTPGILKPAVTLYYLITYKDHAIPYGTW